VVWCGVVWCGVVWCGVVWCGVVWDVMECKNSINHLHIEFIRFPFLVPCLSRVAAFVVSSSITDLVPRNFCILYEVPTLFLLKYTRGVCCVSYTENVLKCLDQIQTRIGVISDQKSISKNNTNQPVRS
jgi:hypothetical protein